MKCGRAYDVLLQHYNIHYISDTWPLYLVMPDYVLYVGSILTYKMVILRIPFQREAIVIAVVIIIIIIIIYTQYS